MPGVPCSKPIDSYFSGFSEKNVKILAFYGPNLITILKKCRCCKSLQKVGSTQNNSYWFLDRLQLNFLSVHEKSKYLPRICKLSLAQK